MIWINVNQAVEEHTAAMDLRTSRSILEAGKSAKDRESVKVLEIVAKILCDIFKVNVARLFVFIPDRYFGILNLTS